MKNILGGNSRLTRSNVKQIQNEYYEDTIRKNSLIYDGKQEQIALGGYSKDLGVRQNSSVNNLNLMNAENALLKKRHRLASYEGFFGNEKENFGHYRKKSIDENEILNTFCKEIRYDSNEEENFEIDDLIVSNLKSFNPLSALSLRGNNDFKSKEIPGRRRSMRNKPLQVKYLFFIPF